MLSRIKLLTMILVLCFGLGTVSASAQQQEKQARLDKLFLVLAQSGSEYQAKQIEQLIWSFWFASDNEQVNSLMQQLLEARDKKDYDAAFKLADQIVKIEPENPEGWNQRATANFLLGDYDRSLEDIVETLKREPRHFGALSGRAYILMKQNKNRQAIETINAALRIHPFLMLRHSIPNVQNSLTL